jgi:hypothetical protein
MNIHVRKSNKSDVIDVWNWWNDPVTRKMMAKKEFVPLEEHVAWFNKLLTDPDRLMCIGLINDIKIGVVRFDLRDDVKKKWEVSINLNPQFRGCKLAAKLLTQCTDFFYSIHGDSLLYANVGEALNIASQKTFLKAEFKKIYDPSYKFHYEFRRNNK